MLYKDVDDLFRTRRTPWKWIAAGVVLAVVVLLLLVRSKDGPGSQPAAEDTGATVPTAAAQAAGTSPGTAAATTTADSTAELPRTQVSRPVAAGEPTIPVKKINDSIAKARQLENDDKLSEAREELLGLLETPASLGSYQRQVESRLAAVNIALVVSQRPMPGKVGHVIKSGDLLSKIAARYNCPAELIQRANGIANPDLIRPGNTVYLLDHPKFVIEISKNRNDLVLTLDGKFFKRYNVGTGIYGKTPEGSFVISDKIPEPPWWRPDGGVIPFGDPENILGTRWLALQASGSTPPVSGYGIHGTWDPKSIGSQSSAGCVRMLNEEVEELFMLIPRGTRVVITR